MNSKMPLKERKKPMKGIAVILLAAILLAASGCTGSADRSGTKYNRADADEIHIGIAYPVELMSNNTLYRQGIDLALSEVNSAGGVLGKTLKTVVRDDNNSAQTAMQIANTFSEEGITAVIGHWSTNICYIVEEVYEHNEVVMITPDSTGMNLFENEYQYIFRMIANNQVYAEAIAGHMSESGYARTAIIYSDDEYGQDFASVIEEELSKRDIAVVDRVAGFTRASIGDIIDRWKAFGCRSVVVASSHIYNAELTRLVFEADSTLVMYGADNLEELRYDDTLGDIAERLYIAIYMPEYIDGVFLDNFRSAYGQEPDSLAMAGYNCVYLLKNAIEATGSYESDAIAGYISQLSNYKAVTGTLTYNPETQEFDGFHVDVYKFAR